MLDVVTSPQPPSARRAPDHPPGLVSSVGTEPPEQITGMIMRILVFPEHFLRAGTRAEHFTRGISVNPTARDMGRIPFRRSEQCPARGGGPRSPVHVNPRVFAGRPRSAFLFGLPNGVHLGTK